MPVDNATQQTASTTLVNAAETTALTVNAARTAAPGVVSVGGAPTGVRIRGLLVVTTGATVTSLVVRIRIGSITGTVVQSFTYAAAASTTGVAAPFEAIDTTAANVGGGNDYFITVVQTGGSTNGAVTFAAAEAEPVCASAA